MNTVYIPNSKDTIIEIIKSYPENIRKRLEQKYGSIVNLRQFALLLSAFSQKSYAMHKYLENAKQEEKSLLKWIDENPPIDIRIPFKKFEKGFIVS